MANLDYRKVLQIILSIAAGFLFLMATHFSARATQTLTFVIPASDGYGISECLLPSATCGQIVADAWCEAHGLGQSRAYGRAEDITASTGVADVPHATPGSFVVNCED